ncbi:MAG: hypothetical protein RL148_1544 [Planctomycetota bacterium]
MPALTGSLPRTAPVASVLATGPLRVRLRRRLGDGTVTQQVLCKVLALDPPTVLRALHQTLAPAWQVQREHWTLGALVGALGPAMVRRMLDAPLPDAASVHARHDLWLHALATAHAARVLAESCGVTDPEEAYLLGLLHDYPSWHDAVAPDEPLADAGAVAARWCLPRTLVDAVAGMHRPPGTTVDAAALLGAAELLAEMAGFPHPGASHAGTRSGFAGLAGDAALAARVQSLVVEALRDFGLDREALRNAAADPTSDAALALFPNLEPRDPLAVLQNLFGKGNSNSYHSIATSACAAAMRFLRFDRVVHVKWNSTAGRAVLRNKAELSQRRLPLQAVPVTERERKALDDGIAGGVPVRLRRIGADGLLASLAIEEALLLPVNREFSTPGFLVLDRTPSMRPITDDCVERAAALGQTCSLLLENLLLTLRLIRAQEFALTDALTRLYNRGMGMRTLEQEIARSRRNGLPLTVLMIDLDEFKKLNDRFGHLQGDVALRATADQLRKTVRRTDTVCRYGGEEFMVVLPETTPEDASVLAARLFTGVEECGKELNLPITISIGLSSMRDGDDAGRILERADRALYASKNQGRNRFSIDVDYED